MTVYDPNQSPETTPPTSYLPPPPTGALAGVETQPTTGGDRWALVALTVALTVLLSCVPGVNCLAPLVAGVVALTQAKNAADPQRARTYAWIATAIGALILLGTLLLLAFYGVFLFAALEQAQNGDF